MKIPKDMQEEIKSNGSVDNSKYTLEYFLEKESRQKEKMRGYYLKKKYNTTLEQYETLLKAQNGECAICRTTVTRKRLAIDHHHKSGKNRGLLCTRCNVGLGYFLDNPLFLRSAANYIDAYNSNIDISSLL